MMKKEQSISYLPILRELTHSLHQAGPDLTNFIKADMNDVVEYDVEDGNAVAFGIYNIPEIAVSKTFMSKGTIFPEHEHESLEWIILYEGSVTVKCEGKNWKINKGQGFYILNNTPHTVEAHDDTWMIVITIPADKGFPDVRYK